MNITRLLLLNCLLCLFSGMGWAQDSPGCNESQVAALNKVIEPWVQPATQDDSSPILSLACKSWPAQPGLSIVSAIFESNTQANASYAGAEAGTKEWITLVADKKSANVLAFHRGHIDVDAAVRIHAKSVVIDTAAYRLAPGIVAFGIRKNIGYSPHCADGGVNEFLTLFVLSHGKLQPVLGEPHLMSWSIDFAAGHHPCGPKPADYFLAQGSTLLRMLKTSSHGFHDIELVTTVVPSWEKAEGQVARYPSITAKLTARYDGKRYAMPDWSAHASAAEERALQSAAVESSKR